MQLGPIMLDIAGHELTQEDRDVLHHPLVGGVILFTRNFGDVAQLTQLVNAIHAIRDPHLLIAVDHEGGRVQRFRDGFSRLPAAGRIGEVFATNPDKARQLAEEVGWLMATELRCIGIDFSFAPVLDLNYGVSKVIGDRAFHRDPATVFELAYAYIKGMQAAGMAATGKHFPGHGAVVADSHTDIPRDTRDFDTVWSEDITPFRRLIDNGLAAIMPAHVIYSQIDQAAAGFSRFWLQTVLREKLNFQGVIFSDDLNMEGASIAGSDYVARAQAAFSAGCDMALICNNRPAAIQILDKFEALVNPVSRLRLVRMHGRHAYTHTELIHLPRWTQVRQDIERLLENPTYAFQF